MSSSTTAAEQAIAEAQPYRKDEVGALLLVDGQSLTSHGHEAVSGSGNTTRIQYDPGVAVIKGHDTGVVHVPIHNPPGVAVQIRQQHNIQPQGGSPTGDDASIEFWTGSWTLDAISVKFGSVHGGDVKRVSLYYDRDLIVSTGNIHPNSNLPGTYDIKFTADEAIKYGYVPPKGISVTLDLKFPHADSAINLWSITLFYKFLRPFGSKRVCISLVKKSPSICSTIAQ